MTHTPLNETDLETVNGGALARSSVNGDIPATKYILNQKVQFINPNDPSEILVGIIRIVQPGAAEDGSNNYVIMVSSSEEEAAMLVGRNYRVNEKNILSVAG